MINTVRTIGREVKSSAKAFRLMAFGLMLTLASPAAEPIKMVSLKVGSKVYRRVTILGASDTDLYFKHSAGISNVKLRYLDPELQKRFDYDPKRAEEAEQRQLQEDSDYHETVALEIKSHAQKVAATAAAEAAATQRAARSENSVADPTSNQSLLNQPAPKLEVAKWLGEEPQIEGKAVLVLFWAPWSVPCRKAIADMNNLKKAFRDEVVVVGLAGEEENEVAEFNAAKIDFPLAVDPKGKLASAAGVTSVPQVLLIDSKGIVRYVGHPAALDAVALKKLLAKPVE